VLIDARSVPSGSEFECDLCVVGAGPAGITLVDRLRDSNLSIVLLESGALDPELPTQRLYQGESRGQRYFRLEACRYRLFGGSSNRWGGWCRPLDPEDFERRDWLPWSGWPIASTTLEPYYAETARLFELKDARFDLAGWQSQMPTPLTLDGSNFQNVLFHFSPETNFGATYRERLTAAPNVVTLLRANLTSIELKENSRQVGLLRVSTLKGRTIVVRPRAVVLAAGGIENARLLLASQADSPTGIGNEHDIVGRFFMEHPHVPLGHMLPNAPATKLQFYQRGLYDGESIRGLIAPTPVARDSHKLLSTSIAIERPSYVFGTPFVFWPATVTFGPVWFYRMLRRRGLVAVADALRRTAERAGRAPARLRTFREARAALWRDGGQNQYRSLRALYFRSEQAPNPASRVLLSDRRDSLGVPQVRLEWRLSSIDFDAISGWLDLFDRDIRAQGIGRIIPPADGWQSRIIGGPHHMGTTRMSSDPRHGVVDENCRVHSVDNLYVAGSSTFSTGGYVNPTFTLVALALRLADTLRSRLCTK
jgi:choline dehydrogenase-like flavoprotein